QIRFQGPAQNIEIGETRRIEMDLLPGWNLISLTEDPLATDPDRFFGALKIGRVLTQDAAGTFERVDQLESKRGYWVFSPRGGSLSQLAAPLLDPAPPVSQGWSLLTPTSPISSQIAWRFDASSQSWRRSAIPQSGVAYFIYGEGSNARSENLLDVFEEEQQGR
ncbi:MAG: hypothetical protein ACI8W8_001597, partial [Rhodothermales bacterium]